MKKGILLRIFIVFLMLSCLTLNAKEKAVFILMQTDKGDMYFKLTADKTPLTVENFLKYVDSGFYKGTIFHRVIDNFMVQGGGYDINEQEKQNLPPVKNEAANGIKNNFGTIAMARTSAPHSATSQFFINVKDNDFLNHPGQDGYGYCAFGELVAGLETLNALKSVAVRRGRLGQHVPVKQLVILDVRRVEANDEGMLAMKERDDEKKKEIEEERERLRKERENIKEKMTALASAANGGKELEGMKSTASGIKYVALKEGSGESAEKADTVRLHYSGRLGNGKEFDSSFANGNPVEFPLNRVIPGFSESIRLMREGGHCIFYIPHALAYGSKGAGAAIPPNTDLVFEIKLIKIIK